MPQHGRARGRHDRVHYLPSALTPSRRWGPKRTVITRRSRQRGPAQGISDPVDGVEPRRDQPNLQDCLVIETHTAQRGVIARRDLRGVLRQLHNILDHHSFLLGQRRRSNILTQRLDQGIVQGHPTQKLCVRFDSVVTTVCH
jgi:hypothetical protein